MVLSLEAKKQSDSVWEVYTNSGRERTNINAIDWAKQAEELERARYFLHL